MKQGNKPKVVHMVTSDRSVGLMKGQLSYLRKAGFDVTVISSPGEGLNRAEKEEGIKIKAISMERTISIFKDFISLIKIIYFFMREKPHVCNSGTPKAGLLGMIAAKITNVPFKVYTIRGLPLEGAQGFKRRILIMAEKIACRCADKVICISPSIEKKALELGLTTKNKTIVFGDGSSNGLQLEKYEYNSQIENEIKKIMESYKLDKYEFIIGYVGRINNFKGVKELVNAFEMLQKKYNNIGLLLVGPREEKDKIPEETNKKIIANPHIKEVGKVNNPIPYYYIMDVLAFPTYREGFGNVSIEAQATGTPVVTTNATGAIDTVVNGETGFIVNVKDEIELKLALEKFIKNPSLIKEMGEKAKKRVKEKFDSKIIWNGLRTLYRSELK